jgi:putative copper resistance protein D
MSGLDTLALLARMADLSATVLLVGISVFGRPAPRLGRAVLVAALVLPLLRLGLQAAALADPGQLVATLRLVAFDTRYGHVMLTRAALAVLWFVTLRGGTRSTLTAVLVVADIAALALLGHGAASQYPLFGAAVLGVHIGAASLWLSGMAMTLFGILRRGDGLARLRGFAPLGLACVALLIVTGLLNVQIATGDLAMAFGGSYGVILIAKLVCFAAMLALAAVNRFALLPNLDRPGAAAHRAMQALAAETVLGGVVIALAALLASGPPGG